MLRGKFHLLKWPALALLALFAAFLPARSCYENRLARQIWPVVAPEISAVSNSPPDFKSTVLLLGDSRMAQWDLPQLAGWRVVNAGAGGFDDGTTRLVRGEIAGRVPPRRGRAGGGHQ